MKLTQPQLRTLRETLDAPAVTVVYRSGNMRAAEALTRMGLLSVALSGGMRGWSRNDAGRAALAKEKGKRNA